MTVEQIKTKYLAAMLKRNRLQLECLKYKHSYAESISLESYPIIETVIGGKENGIVEISNILYNDLAEELFLHFESVEKAYKEHAHTIPPNK